MLQCAACAGLAAAPFGDAQGTIFKCTDASGRILYSDAPCPGGSRGEVVAPDENSPIPATSAPAPQRNGAAAVRTATDEPAQQAGDRYEPSVNERQRIVNLEQVQRAGDNAEKRQAARMEIDETRRGTVARMSYDDRRRKDGYWVDLGNLDQRRRAVAVQQLAALFAAYQ
ncbi:MAG TPA: DUF4124 domain-containing protein [Casimicrobiaceae bacterium]|jgi:hypothetical protein|nr:DUF4124 domain-containing protein [Casimicrobiaceae bacterium]